MEIKSAHHQTFALEKLASGGWEINPRMPRINSLKIAPPQRNYQFWIFCFLIEVGQL